MTALAWTPADYFAASRRARRAFDLTNEQTVMFDADALDSPAHVKRARGAAGLLRCGRVERVPVMADTAASPLTAVVERARPSTKERA